jgi:hypothetical protein
MAKIWIIVLLFLSVTNVDGQSKTYPFYQLYQLDSIASSPGIARHFGKLYGDFLRLVEKRLEKADSSTTRLLRHFEMVFAGFYIEAAQQYLAQKPVTHPSWKKYFEDSTLSRAQFFLLGTNAHLNGQLAEAIFNSYSKAEWKMLRKHYDLFNKCLNETYRYVYRETLDEHPRARTLHLLSLGLDKLAGNYFLYKWRKRQMRVTELRFEDSNKYSELFTRIRKKKDKLDRLIIIQLLDKEGREKYKKKGF